MGVLAAVLGAATSVTFGQAGEGEKRGSIPVGTSQDGSGPSDGALIGGTLKPDIGKSKEPLRDVNRCKELIGARPGRHRRRRGRQCADARAGELALRGSEAPPEISEQARSGTAAPQRERRSFLPVHCAVFPDRNGAHRPEIRRHFGRLGRPNPQRRTAHCQVEGGGS
jgi:hypothetical protein